MKELTESHEAHEEKEENDGDEFGPKEQEEDRQVE